jgi:UDP-2,3-diacylglucosamine hydrolase
LADPQAKFEQECLKVLRAVSQRLPVFWVAGNRDFLLGPAACATAGMQALSDPCVLQTKDGNWLLSHGDALCLSDTDYMAFRRMVRTPQWQHSFMSRSLQERLQLAQQMRAQSQARKASQTAWADVDAHASNEWLNQHQANRLIHGHTHQPADHPLSGDWQRHVLSDWDANAQPARLQAFEWQASDGFNRRSLIP